MTVSGRRRVAVFVDGSNTYYAMRDTLAWTLDWKRFRTFLEGFGYVSECTYYVGRSDDPKHDSFLSMLAHSGYSIVAKDLKTIHDADGVPFQKANVDVEIAVDMVGRTDAYDTAVLVSGDGDYERALRFVRDRGKDVFVVSTQRRLAQELFWLVGRNFIELGELRGELELQRAVAEH